MQKDSAVPVANTPVVKGLFTSAPTEQLLQKLQIGMNQGARHLDNSELIAGADLFTNLTALGELLREQFLLAIRERPEHVREEIVRKIAQK